MEFLDGVLAYMLLNNANLPEEKIQLVQTTVNEIKYQLKKVFISLSFEKRSRKESVNIEQSISFMLILARGNTMTMFFTVNQVLKKLHKTARTVTKKEKVGFYKIP